MKVAQEKNTEYSDDIILLLEARITELIRESEQFTYIVSHDLQAPLRSITGFLELIEKRYGEKLDDTGRQYIEFALKGSQKIKTLITDLLEYSRLNTTDFQMSKTSLMEIIQEVKEDMGDLIRQTGTQLVYSGLPIVYGNRKLLVLLFSHLLDNAIKFKGTSAPEVLISSETFPDYKIISVRDNGMGIAQSFLEKIFVIFRRLNTDEHRFPGSGKGLAICKKIVTIHGWEITADSKSGEWTEITIKITNGIDNS